MFSFKQARQYDEIAGVRPIARRYFAMNAFDGVVTIIGVLAGAMAAGVTRASVVVVTGLATSTAMGISGLIGAYLTESAERERSRHELEEQTLTDLEDTLVGRAERFAVWVATLVDGISPMVAGATVLIPFFLASWLPDIRWAYRTSLALALAVLFALGAYLGRISKGRAWVYGIKTALAGAVAIGASVLLGMLN